MNYDDIQKKVAKMTANTEVPGELRELLESGIITIIAKSFYVENMQKLPKKVSSMIATTTPTENGMRITFCKKRGGGRPLLRAALPCCLLLAQGGAAFGASGEEKAAYEKNLAVKADAALSVLLGSGKAKVLVNLTLEPQEGAALPAGIGRVTVFMAASDSATDAEIEKAREALGRTLELAPGRGDEVLVLRPGFAAAKAGGSYGGLAGYAWQGLLVLIGMFVAFFFSRARKSVQDEKNVTARRAPAPGTPREKYVPPPAQPQAGPAESQEVNIPSRSGFYKR